MKKSVKIIIIIAAVLVVLAGAGAFFAIKFFAGTPKETYRSVDVEEYEGKVSIKRKETGDKMDPYEGLKLIPKDKVETKKDSSIVLLVDSDKHIEAGENTKFSINATGDEEKGKVTIDLEEGKALFTIDNKLNEDSSFKVKTPNATMSVRGTTFEVTYDEKKAATVLNVIKGKVAVETELYDEEILVSKGEAILIYEDMNGEIIEPEMIEEYLEQLPDADNSEEDDSQIIAVDGSGDASNDNSIESGFNKSLAKKLFAADSYEAAYYTILSDYHSYITEPENSVSGYEEFTHGTANLLGDDNPELVIKCKYLYSMDSVFYSYDSYIYTYSDGYVYLVCTWEDFFVRADGRPATFWFSRGTGYAESNAYEYDPSTGTFQGVPDNPVWTGTLGDKSYCEGANMLDTPL